MSSQTVRSRLVSALICLTLGAASQSSAPHFGVSPLAAQTPATITHAAALHHTWASTSAIDGHLAIGDAVTVTSHRAGYSHVHTTSGAVGWAYSSYVNEGGASPTPAPTPAPAGGIANSIAAVEALPKQPHGTVGTIGGCPAAGRSSSSAKVDAGTDSLKNRTDEGAWTEVSFAAMLHLPWQGMPTRRFNWLHDDSVRSQRYESAPVSVVGYLVAVHPEGAESTNCGDTSNAGVDWHMWLVETPGEATASPPVKKNAVVVEVTPRVRRAFATRFDLAGVRAFAPGKQKVRVSGWLMLDPDHPSDATGTPNKKPSRGTIWEIHPVLKIEPVP